MNNIKRLLASAALSLMLAAPAALADTAVTDRDAWLSSAVEKIETGDLAALQSQINDTLGPTMQGEVNVLITPLRQQLDDQAALYVDKIDHAEMGTSFDQHLFAAYYGDRDFIFYTFTFARLEDGWHLYAMDYADTLADVQ